MIIYHGSYTEVRKPDIKYSRINLDFGRGFYVTPLEEQAKNWSLKFKKKNKNAIVSIYTLDDNALFFDGLIDKKETLKRLKYEKPNMQIAFRKQSVIDKYLSFERSFKL